ncbi:hypothetical protein RND71_027780 [Anisodus tanguticus]|uniref:Uncharacterized protein n=1 Tax=Anisodus tanguticus TaxID=243964 RepID=A0AAE1RK96_9SOLA|nr:hypothetical protein RND71_027780 [Anisodus tanguticus]
MMNQAVEGLEVVQPGLKNISYLRVLEKRRFETQKKAASQTQSRPSVGSNSGIQVDGTGGVDMIVKEIIEDHAQRNGLLFKPKPGRMTLFNFFGVLEKRRFETQKKAASQTQSRPSVGSNSGIQVDGTGGVDMIVKEIIEDHAQRNGLLFKPKPGRMTLFNL